MRGAELSELRVERVELRAGGHELGRFRAERQRRRRRGVAALRTEKLVFRLPAIGDVAADLLLILAAQLGIGDVLVEMINGEREVLQIVGIDAGKLVMRFARFRLNREEFFERLRRFRVVLPRFRLHGLHVKRMRRLHVAGVVAAGDRENQTKPRDGEKREKRSIHEQVSPVTDVRTSGASATI